jgi:hypothetical protein
MIGSDELPQDYDPYGEGEMVPFDHRIGIPFGVLLGLGVAGGIAWRQRGREDPARWRPVGLVLAGLVVATVAANLLYFTSSQHRLPLCVPAAFVLPLGIVWLRDAVARRRYVVVVLLVLAVGLTFVPRGKQREPSGQHYYNVAIAWLAVAEPTRAREALDRAVQLLPDHPVIRLERARLARTFADPATARTDLEILDTLPDVPPWIVDAAAEERRRLAAP